LARTVLVREGGPLVDTIVDSLDRGTKLLVTLRSGKVYVGAVSMTLNRLRQPGSLRLIVDKSGYRDAETKNVSLDVPYDRTHAQMRDELNAKYDEMIRRELTNTYSFTELSDHARREGIADAMVEAIYRRALHREDLERLAAMFSIVIPIAEITTLAPHDDAVFKRFESHSKSGPT
jgi:hypothetical protein